MTNAVAIAAIYWIAAAAAVVLAIRAMRSDSAVGREVLGMALCVAEWSLFYGIEILAESREYRQLWSQFAYVGTYGTVAFLLRFSLRWLRPQRAGWWMFLIWVMPVIMVLGAFTNQSHHLVWTSITQSSRYPFIWEYGRGPLFWIGIASLYVMIAISLLLIVASLFRRRGIYRQQAVFVFVGVLVPVVGNCIYLLRLIPGFPLDITPIGLAFAAAFFLAGVSRAHLLELVPAALRRVVDVMPDGLLVLDPGMKIVDWNRAVDEMWMVTRSDLTGAPVSEVVHTWDRMVPDDPPDQFRTTFLTADINSDQRHIDLDLRRFSDRAASHRGWFGTRRGWIALFHDSTEMRVTERRLQEANDRLESLNQELQRQALHDGMTGLFNRTYLDEALPREFARAKREGGSIAILILDIDHFKLVNDRYGHSTGDEVLVGVADLVRGLVRAADIPCRFGGDEIVAVMPGASAGEARRIGERVRESVAARQFGAEGTVAVTISAGYAVYPTNAETSPELFRTADRALYLAKDGGRNRTVGAEALSDGGD